MTSTSGPRATALDGHGPWGSEGNLDFHRLGAGQAPPGVSPRQVTLSGQALSWPRRSEPELEMIPTASTSLLLGWSQVPSVPAWGPLEAQSAIYLSLINKEWERKVIII